MTGKIFRLTFFTTAFLLAACFLIISYTLFGSFEDKMKNELKDEAGYISFSIEDGYDKFFNNFSDRQKRVTLISADGSVLADTETDAKELENHSDRAEFLEAKKTGEGYSVRYSDTMTKKTLYYAVALKDGNVLRISMTSNTLVSAFLGLIKWFLPILLIALVFSFMFSVWISKSIARPINRIDPENPEECETYDELSPLLLKISKQKKKMNEQINFTNRIKNEFDLVTENMSEGFLVIDNRANILSCNNSALKLLNAKSSEGNILSLNHDTDFIGIVKTALCGKRYTGNMKFFDSTYTVVSNPIFDDNEKVSGAVIIIIDITESAKREAIRREFTANVSHELKTPLTSISGFAELMMDEDIPKSTVADFSKSIYDEAQRLISLVGDIIKISELDEGGDNFAKESVDLYALSGEIISRMKPYADKKGIELKLLGNTKTVIGSRKILDDMIYNLLDNAIKYNRPGGNATVSVSEEDEKIILSVNDTGIGIDPSLTDRIFERFYRIDKSRQRSDGGTGLGLSIVKHGAIFHNAKITVDSKVDAGTEICIIFPKNVTITDLA